MRKFFLVLIVWIALAPPAAVAVEPGERLDDPVLEARARDISKGLRCLVCQNQSIDDSDAGLARDLRVLVRERLSGGETNDQVIAYVTARYGDYVLLKPPVKPATYVLWFGPPALFALGVLVVVIYVRRLRSRRAASAAAAESGAVPLSDVERTRLARLLDEDPDSA